MKQPINEIKRMQQLAGIISENIDTKDWKNILMPFYKKVINKIGEPDMSLNIYSRWVGDFIKYANTFTSNDALVKHGFDGNEINSDEDLKNQLINFIKRYK